MRFFLIKNLFVELKKHLNRNFDYKCLEFDTLTSSEDIEFVS